MESQPFHKIYLVFFVISIWSLLYTDIILILKNRCFLSLKYDRFFYSVCSSLLQTLYVIFVFRLTIHQSVKDSISRRQKELLWSFHVPVSVERLPKVYLSPLSVLLTLKPSLLLSSLSLHRRGKRERNSFTRQKHSECSIQLLYLVTFGSRWRLHLYLPIITHFSPKVVDDLLF